MLIHTKDKTLYYARVLRYELYKYTELWWRIGYDYPRSFVATCHLLTKAGPLHRLLFRVLLESVGVSLLLLLRVFAPAGLLRPFKPVQEVSPQTEAKRAASGMVHKVGTL